MGEGGGVVQKPINVLQVTFQKRKTCCYFEINFWQQKSCQNSPHLSVPLKVNANTLSSHSPVIKTMELTLDYECDY